MAIRVRGGMWCSREHKTVTAVRTVTIFGVLRPPKAGKWTCPDCGAAAAPVKSWAQRRALAKAEARDGRPMFTGLLGILRDVLGVGGGGRTVGRCEAHGHLLKAGREFCPIDNSRVRVSDADEFERTG